MSDVTLIGLGLMGQALGKALLKDGHRLTVWNRTPARAETLVREGAVQAADIRGAVSASPIVVVCVLDYPASHAILDEVASALAGKVLVQLTTGTPLEAQEEEGWARGLGCDYLDGALLAVPSQIGRPDTPIFLSGAERAYTKAEPVLRAMGGNLQYMGAPVGRAAAWDIATLCTMFGAMFGFLHGVRVCETEGLGVGAFGNMVGQIAPVIGEMIRGQGQAIQAEDYANPESTMALCAAAGTLFLRQAKEAGIDTGFPTFADGLFRRAMSAGLGEEKFAAMIKILRT